MIELTTLLVGSILALAFVWWMSTRRPNGSPPGPGFALPVVGHMHLVKKDPRAQFAEWRRQYGDVFSFYFGGQLMVILNGFDVIKDALVKNADAFNDRPHVFFVDHIRKNQGVSSTSGDYWKEQRKATVEILRELGMGKNILAEKIQEEVSHYITTVASYQGQAVDLKELTNISVSNNICSILLGKRFEYDDQGFIRYLDGLEETMKVIGVTSVLNIFPFLRHIPGDPFHAKRVLAETDHIDNTFLTPHLRKHVENYSEGAANDFIDAYLQRINEHKGKPTTLNETNLQKVLGDLFIAGSETTSTFIMWTLLIFLHYPDVQEKCFQEINQVTGTQRAPSMRDKPEMTYLEATFMEVQRWVNVAPLSVWHGVAYDVKFRGYYIPKGTLLVTNLDSIFTDPKIWHDPQLFRPERFIQTDGKLNRPEEFIPFGIGKRFCLGEALARMEIFLYLATMVQHFRFLPADDGPLPPLDGKLGLFYVARSYKIRACIRQRERVA